MLLHYCINRLKEFSDRCNHLVAHLDLEILNPSNNMTGDLLNPSQLTGSEILNPHTDINPADKARYWSSDRFHLSPEGYDLLGIACDNLHSSSSSSILCCKLSFTTIDALTING